MERLDDVIKLSGRELLERVGKINSKTAKEKAQAEYDKYKAKTKDELSEVEKHYLESIKQAQK